MKLSISTTRRQTLLGWAYWLISLFVLPSVLDIINGCLTTPLPESVLNLIYFTVNFLAVMCIFHRFLWESLKAAAKKPLKCLGVAAVGVLVDCAANWLVSIVIMIIKPDFSNVNDDAILGMIRDHTSFFVFATVFLVPITEETFYRGTLFQSLYHKSRKIALAVSVLTFAAVHVVDYIGFFDPLTLLLCFVQYLPSGILLALAYEETDTVITPILIHIFMNLIGIFVTR